MDTLGDRMKTYERVSDFTLSNRLPVIVRIDGVNFHSFTKRMRFTKPYDMRMIMAMLGTALSLCKRIDGVQLAYIQSDEISFLLKNNQTLYTTPFRGNRVNKINTDFATIATLEFAKACQLNIEEDPEARFDSRCFILPENEVCNYFIWRQLDAWRNFVSNVSYHELGKKHGRKTAQKMMHGLNINEQQELLFRETGININNYLPLEKRGGCVYKQMGESYPYWYIDTNISLFTNDRQFIEKWV